LDYGVCEATTTYGIIGVKVWIYKGDVLEHDPMARDKRMGENLGATKRD
jgi:small subunit ribosomal protein S3